MWTRTRGGPVLGWQRASCCSRICPRMAGGDGMPRKSFEWHGDLGVLFLSVHVCGCVVAGGCFA